jgi:hypothetical protein
MSVWIVLKNGEVDEVFSSEAAAQHHAANLKRRWNITKIIRRMVQEI